MGSKASLAASDRRAMRSAANVRGVGLVLGLLLWLCAQSAVARAADPFVAFSLREAAQAMRTAKMGPRAVESSRLAGITRIAGMVYDPASQDIIIVGQAHESESSLSLDDFVVALRAVAVHKCWPLVSIDESPDSGKTRIQKVRFEGGIAQSAFGRALYEADVLLKDLVLGKRSAEVWGVKSYVALSGDEVRRSGARGTSSVRFWYVTDDSRMTSRGNVFALDELRIALRTEAQPAASAASAPASRVGADPAGERFARDISAGFDNLAVAYRPLARLRQLSALTALAGGVQSLAAQPHLDYWLNQYVPATVDTPREHPLITTSVDVRKDGKVIDLHISGGVQLSAAVRRLRDGDVSAMEEAVLRSRPSSGALSWRVPLDGWRLAGYPDSASPDTASTTPAATGAGTTVTKFVGAITAPTAPPLMQMVRPPPPSPLPSFATSPAFTRQVEVPRVGGVMLAGEATVVEGSKAASRAAAFSLLASGEGAGLTPLAHRRFVTALWSVYYSEEDPGISIDPISWGADRQLVRYIGRVVNTDLGRVMREADYAMKKWAVGTERPDIEGFKDVETLAGRRGITLSDAFRRFWFVPEGMRFRATADTLVFDNGRIRLRTESNVFGQRTPPIASDERFAGFFTENYDRIAAKYPVFDDLFEYAKLVALAKYLKRQGVPLQWFLLAHHDQVLTELSSGSVETLSKGSRFADDIRIEGGVDLASRYVLDQTTANALRRAVASTAPVSGPTGETPAAASRSSTSAPASFRYEGKAYSIVSQHSMAMGKDSYGTRYQTDISVRDGGRPGLELIRFFRLGSGAERVGAEMGTGWRLMIPLRAHALGPPDQPFNTVLVPRQWRIRNQLNGRDEILTLDTQVFAQHGYRPADMEQSRFVGMFWTAGGLLRLADKFGNEFWFDASGLMREMHFSKDFGVRFEYDLLDVPRDDRTAPPLRLVSEGKDSDDRFNVKLPRRLRLVDAAKGTQDVFVLGDRNGMVAYLPEVPSRSAVRVISLRRDGSHALVDIDGNETWFDLGLRFVRQRMRVVSGMVQGRYEFNREKTDLAFVGRHRIRFEHEFDGQAFRVTKAALYREGSADVAQTINYRYGADGMLAAAEALSGR